MIVGNKNVDSNQLALGVDERRVVLFPSLSQNMLPSRVSAYMDGLGGGGGDQRVKGLLYVNNVLVGASREVLISAGSTARWVDFPFYTFPQQSVPAQYTGTGEVAIGLLSGTASNVARVATSLTGGTGFLHADSYVDGPLTYVRGYREEVLKDTPLLYWRLSEASGSTAADETGNNRSGTHQNTPGVGYTTSVPVTGGRAVDYNGTDEYTTSAYSLTLEGNVTSFEAWVYRDNTSTADVLFGTATPSTFFGASLSSGSDSLQLATGSTAFATFASTGISAGAWHHVVVVVDDLQGSATLYVDGVLAGVQTGLSVNYGAAGNFMVAARSSGVNPLDGKLSEVALYDYELTPSRVAEHYAARTRPAATSDSAYLPSLYASLSPIWVAPGTSVVEDDYYAQLGFYTAQNTLSLNVAAESKVVATAGWHGTYVDPERGCFAVVKSDGPLADYVGERVRVTNRRLKKSVVVLVHTESELISEDISLSRRAWMAIAFPSDDEISARVEVLA